MNNVYYSWLNSSDKLPCILLMILRWGFTMASQKLFSLELLTNLNIHYMSMTDYMQKVKQDLLVEKGRYEDAPEFERQNPNHPYNSTNRFTRMGSADEILRLSQSVGTKFNQTELDIIHLHIFDCCAAVRLSLVLALYYVGNKTSVEVLEQLIVNEENAIKSIKSFYVLNNVELLLDILHNDKRTIIYDEYIYVGDIIDSVAEGQGRLYRKYDVSLVHEGIFKNNRFCGQ